MTPATSHIVRTPATMGSSGSFLPPISPRAALNPLATPRTSSRFSTDFVRPHVSHSMDKATLMRDLSELAHIRSTLKLERRRAVCETWDARQRQLKREAARARSAAKLAAAEQARQASEAREEAQGAWVAPPVAVAEELRARSASVIQRHAVRAAWRRAAPGLAAAERRDRCATLIQAKWRGFRTRREMARLHSRRALAVGLAALDSTFGPLRMDLEAESARLIQVRLISKMDPALAPQEGCFRQGRSRSTK